MKIASILALVLSASALFAEEALKTSALPLAGFERDTSGAKGNACALSVVSDGATEGKNALQLKFDPSAAYPSVAFAQDPPADFRGYGGPAFDVYNPSAETVGFAVRMDSSLEEDGNGNNSWSGKSTIDGGQRGSFVIPFGVDPAVLKMIGVPGFGGFRNLGFMGSGPSGRDKFGGWADGSKLEATGYFRVAKHGGNGRSLIRRGGSSYRSVPRP